MSDAPFIQLFNVGDTLRHRDEPSYCVEVLAACYLKAFMGYRVRFLTGQRLESEATFEAAHRYLYRAMPPRRRNLDLEKSPAPVSRL